ncbi:inducible alternative oxidase 2 [Rhodotorula kratochvilovae]
MRVAPAYTRTLTTSRALLSPAPTPRVKEDGKGIKTYEHHFKDTVATAPSAAPGTPSATVAKDGWKPSRPHEAYLMAYPVYSKEELDAIKVIHYEPKTLADQWARWLVKTARWGFDLVSGYKHADSEAARAAAKKDGKGDNLSLQQLRDIGYLMKRDDWMLRILFLESIAGVPGFSAAMLRHLRSLRLMRRDGGWINGLLQEAENERMVRPFAGVLAFHLLTFLKIRGPSPIFRLMVLGAQGVFTNLFFLSYLVSPKSCHRFVGYLEEEAVHTYTGLVKALERNEVPEWAPGTQKVPRIAIDYWRLPEQATMLDLVRAVRADEAGHRFVNHTLANLNKDDPNPVSFKHATADVQGTKPGFTRDESLEWAKQVEDEMTSAKKAGEEEMRRQGQ